MSKEENVKRSVFIDLRYLKYLTNGFGQLALSYAKFFEHNPDRYKDLDITVLVPKQYVGKFGNHIKYIELKKIYKIFPFLLPAFDIVHSITQQVKYTPIGSKTYRIVTIHDLNFLYETPAKAKRKTKRTQHRINLADLITVISRFTQKEIETHLDTKNIPIVLNYHGLKDLSKQPAEKPAFINSDKKFFFTIGQISPKKNFHVLLDLMKIMPEYDLYICGDYSDIYAQQIMERVETEKIDNIFLPGIIKPEEKVWMYKNCHAFLFPSKFEGFGAPLIEAMSFGKPVFSSRMTSLEEIGDKYAFFWDNFETEHMKDVIEKYLPTFYDNESFIEDEKRYAASYSLENHLGKFFEIYRTVELKRKGNIFTAVKNYYNLLKA